MELFESKKYRERTEKAADILKSSGRYLEPEFKRELEILKKRGEVHKKIEAATGGMADIFVSNASNEGHIAGFYDGNSNLREETLDDFNWALHVKKHEDLHGKAILNLDLKKYLSIEHAAVLSSSLHLSDLNVVDWVEGFTELLTIRDDKRNHNCAYLKNEVPAAEKLEKLCIEQTGESLMSAFRLKNTAMFYYLLKKLADNLLIIDAAKGVAESSSELHALLEAIKKRQKHAHLDVRDKRDARKIVMKIWSEELQINSIRSKLQ